VEKLSEFVNNRMRNQLLMGIFLLVIVTLISCKMPEIVESKKVVSTNEESTKTENVEKKTIIIDPGHGGIDPGKVGINGDLEKDINLAIAKKLKIILEENGYEAVLTRDSDVGLYDEYDTNKKRADMWVRRNLINMHHENNESAICVSIHQNSYSDSAVTGPQIFYYEKSDSGKNLAASIQNAMNTGLQVSEPREHKHNDSYYLLLHTTCPTVIAECGFLSSSEESYKLVSEDYQNKIAVTIMQGINDYYRSR